MTTETPTEPRAAADCWNLAELYPTDRDFRASLDAVTAGLPRIASFQGRLGEGAARMLEALAEISRVEDQLRRLASYAHMRQDLDTREASGRALAQEVDLVVTRFQAAASFLSPEVLTLPPELVERYLAEEPLLRPYGHALRDILRRRPHTLSPSEERLLADAGVMAASPDNVYGVLANADIPWPEVPLGDGQRVRLDPSAFVKHRTSPVREDRKAVFRAFFEAWTRYARTFGVTLDAESKKNLFYARARRYRSALEASLDTHRIPVAVYDAVVGAAREALPSLHRYFRLRARLLGLTDLSYHDIYVPLGPRSARTYSIDEARGLVLAAVAPLGEEYTDALRAGYASRWIDVWPATGKRSGAYSNGSVYGEHPFILMNFTGNLDGVSTLAHECGHAMHSFLANAAQPFPTADYPIFVAEVASTFNEALMYRHGIDTAAGDTERLALLCSWLDGMRGTFFRQSMFAEFEREIARVTEQGRTLTSETLGEIYLGLIRAYHGSDQDICAIDDLYAVEWAYIPHFYANFYVFQYATGFAASTCLAKRVLAGGKEVRDGYLAFLRAGGSDYPVELLQRAGVDLTRPEPYRDTVAEMNRVMDEIEAILAKGSGSPA